jgi:hypothetical protein
MACDAAPGIGLRDPGLATERGDEGLIEVGAGDPFSPQAEEERHEFARARIEQGGLDGPDSFPRLDRLVWFAKTSTAWSGERRCASDTPRRLIGGMAVGPGPSAVHGKTGFSVGAEGRQRDRRSEEGEGGNVPLVAARAGRAVLAYAARRM